MLGTLGTGALVALTGCSIFDPTIHGHTPGPSGSPPAEPGELPYLREGLTTEQHLIEAGLGVRLDAAQLRLSPAQIGLVTWVTDAAGRHSAALRAGTPTAPRSPSPTPSPAPTPTFTPRRPASWSRFVGTLQAADSAHLARARSTTGTASAMWASLAAHAAAVAAVPTGGQARSQVWHSAAIEVTDEVSALRTAIAGTHALCFAAELCLTPIDPRSPEHAQMTGVWTKWLRKRDQLSALVRELGGEDPGSKAPYDVQPPASAPAARALLATLETRLLPAAGAWVAAADKSRLQALNLLVDTAVSAAQLGGELQVWPGWPTA